MFAKKRTSDQVMCFVNACCLAAAMAVFWGCSPETDTLKLGHKASASGAAAGVDKGFIPLTRPEAIALVGAGQIPVRAANPQVSGLALPVLILESLSPQQSAARLQSLFSSFVGFGGAVEDGGTYWALKSGSSGSWADKSSGWTHAWHKGGVVTSQVITAQDAVDIALLHASKLSLTKLAPGEWLDLIGVGTEHGVLYDRATQQFVNLTADKAQVPAKQQTLAYHVTLGRRYQGVPVLGSTLTLRVGPRGQLTRLQVHLRRIIGTGKPVPIDTSVATIRARVDDELAKKGITDPGQHQVVSQACGYIEGPMSATQSQLLPGCRVRLHRAGTSSDSDWTVEVPLGPKGSTSTLYQM